MAERLLSTGVELRLPTRWPDKGEVPPAVDERTGEVFVEAHVFAEMEDSGRRYRVGGSVAGGETLPLGEDPTTTLVRIAHEARELSLGDLLGDLRIGGCDLTRFEFYAAPFQIELAADLRERLTGSWRERSPR